MDKVESILTVGIGAAFTKAVLFDVVEGQRRFLARGLAPSSLYGSDANVLTGVTAAIEDLQTIVGRSLLGAKGLVVPAPNDGSGVDDCFVVTSVNNSLRVVVIGATQAKAEELAAEVRGVPSMTVAHLVDYAVEAKSSRSRMAKVVEALHRERPDILAIAADGLAQVDLVELSQAVALSLRSVGRNVALALCGSEETAGTLRQSLPHEGVAIQILAARTAGPGLTPLQERLILLWQERWAESVPGAAELRPNGFGAPLPIQHGFAQALRFLAAHGKRPVWGVDVGAADTTAISVLDGTAKLIAQKGWGVGQGAAALLEAPGAVAQWLPFPFVPSEGEVARGILHKVLHPCNIPETPAKLALEGALAREVVAPAAGQLARETRVAARAQDTTLLVARGAAFAETPGIGHSMLLMLDAYQPVGLVELAIDRLGVLPALGAVAERHPEAAAELILREGLQRLGACLALGGVLKKDQAPAATITLERDGEKIRKQVHFGEMEVLPVAENVTAKLTVKPAGKLDCGSGPGRKVTVVVNGGPIGFAVDARGRPLQLSEMDEKERVDRLAAWREAVGV